MPGQARLAEASRGHARPGLASRGQPRLFQARLGQPRLAEAMPGKARPAGASRGHARLGQARPGLARPGHAWLGQQQCKSVCDISFRTIILFTIPLRICFAKHLNEAMDRAWYASQLHLKHEAHIDVHCACLNGRQPTRSHLQMACHNLGLRGCSTILRACD